MLYDEHGTSPSSWRGEKALNQRLCLFHTRALHSQQASHCSPQHCTQTAQSSSDVEGKGLHQVIQCIHSAVLETLKEVLNFHASYGSEIPYNSCLTRVQALFEKALSAVTAGCKSKNEYLRLNKASVSSHWNDSE